MQRLFIFAFFAVLSLSGCYTLSGISIPDNVEKAYVPLYVENALGAPPTLYIDMTEALRNKVRDEARLEITEDDPDIEMKGTLVDFRVSAEGRTFAMRMMKAGNKISPISSTFLLPRPWLPFRKKPLRTLRSRSMRKYSIRLLPKTGSKKTTNSADKEH